MEDFLTKFRGKLSIPDYQRDYEWKAEQVWQLIEDVEEEADKEYFLGTIILSPAENDEKTCEKKNEWDIVDGQQRLRTLLALLEEADLPRKGEEPRKTIEKVCEELVKERLQKVRCLLRACKIAYIIVDDLKEAFQLFDTQNRRGKPLSAENLLKAYHYGAMMRGPLPSQERVAELERCWEEEIANEQPEKRVKGLLTSLLFFARRGCRGEEKKTFSLQEDLREFQGVTLWMDKMFPAYNVNCLCEYLRNALPKLTLKWGYERLANGLSKDCDPGMQLNGLIVNGEAFFVYAATYARLARQLFSEAINDFEKECRSETLKVFHEFYQNHCLYGECWRVGDGYARMVYETLILLLVDRFGEAGLEMFHKTLWCLAYHERSTCKRLVFGSAGKAYFVRACQAIASAATLPILRRALLRLDMERREAINTEAETLSPFNKTDSCVYKTMKGQVNDGKHHVSHLG